MLWRVPILRPANGRFHYSHSRQTSKYFFGGPSRLKQSYAMIGAFCWGEEGRVCVIQTHSKAPFLYAQM
jgi:hypothetical protein